MSAVSLSLHPKLPLWRTIGQSYAIWARNLPELIRISWLWLLIMTPVLAILMWWQVPTFMAMIDAAKAGRPDPTPALTLLGQVLNGVIMLPVLASIAVAWHRLLLRNEHVGSGIYLRFDGLVLGYGLLFLLIGLLPAVPQYLGQIYLALTQPPGARQVDPVALAITSVGSIVSIVLFFISARMFLLLPAKALERDDVTPGTVWAATRRNSWRMVWGYVFCLLPMFVLGGGIGIAFWLSSTVYSRALATTLWTALTLLWIVFGMVSVGFLSLAYRHFFEQDTSPSP
jgi:hypothetical protein